MTGYVATAETDISASPKQVWTTLTDPEQIREFMFGAHVHTDWRVGHPIVWSGEYEENRTKTRARSSHSSPAAYCE